MDFINLFGVPISITSKPQALALIGEWLKEWKQSLGAHFPKLIVTPNPEIIVAAQSDPEFLKALQDADLAIPDGIGIVWALRILNTEYRIPNKKSASPHSVFSIHNSVLSRLSGLDLMESLIGESAKRGWKVMLLGGKPGVAEKAAEKLRYQIRPGLPSGGQAFIQSISGPKNITLASKKEIDDLISSVNRFRSDLLFVAFGHGKQEKWLTANRDRLTAGVAMAVGGAFDQIADPSLRPPPYINSIGLGWLYRLLRQPWRWRRQLALLKFIGMVVKALKH